jgi:hypothetical protein
LSRLVGPSQRPSVMGGGAIDIVLLFTPGPPHLIDVLANTSEFVKFGAWRVTGLLAKLCNGMTDNVAGGKMTATGISQARSARTTRSGLALSVSSDKNSCKLPRIPARLSIVDKGKSW